MPQATRKRRMVVDEAEDGGEDEVSEEEPTRNKQRQRRQVPSSDDSDVDSVENGGPITQEELGINRDEDGSKGQLVKKLVRYALACEYARLPIRRDNIRDKVLGKHKTPFKRVFDAAQKQLQTKFGMEMMELPVKERITLKDRRAVSKAAQGLASSKTYILISTLPAAYRIPEILPPSTVPTASTEAAYTALYTMIISLISLCGGTLSDAKLDRYLKRMNADANMPMDKTEVTLQKMIKQGYVVKIKETVAGEETTDWMVGPRGKVEVGNRGVKGLVMDVYGENAPEDLAERIKSSLGLDIVSVGQDDEEAPPGNVENGQESAGKPKGRRRRLVDEDE